MGLQIWKRLTVTDKKGWIVSDSGMQPSHSYVLNFLKLVQGFYQEDYGVALTVTAKDVANSDQTLLAGASLFTTVGRVDAADDIDVYGIQVGTNAGVTAESNTNYAIDTLIAHGTGANQLNYEQVTFVAPRVVGANIDFDISRPFVNESGGTITVKEITLVCKNTATTKYFLLLRDVTADTDVPDDNTLTVVYTLRTTA